MAEFLDKMLVGINKGMNSVSEGSKNLMEKARLNTEIKDNEAKKAHIAQQLGLLAYNLQSKGDISIEQFQAMCDEITQYNSVIEKLKANLQALDIPKAPPAAPQPQYQNGIVCGCGFTNKPDAKFCAKCGSKLEQ